MTTITDTLQEAVQEVDAVLREQEEGVNRILTVIEEIREASDQQSDALVKRLSDLTLACSFHDLCSQRLVKLKKIVMTLRDDNPAIGKVDWKSADDNEKELLNGPALPGGGLDQSDIDRLLDD